MSCGAPVPTFDGERPAREIAEQFGLSEGSDACGAEFRAIVGPDRDTRACAVGGGIVEAGQRRVLGEYTFHHTPWPGVS